jgi:pSer/pThr/pTyr-binding forkhead associated (FHA) protein
MRLVIEDAEGTRSAVPFASDELVVGRAAAGVAFRLADRDVSRRHARFVRQSGTVWVEDLGSLTGTRVNGDKISGRRKLRQGDLVEIGDYDLVVDADEGSAQAGAPPPLPAAARSPADPRVEPTAITREMPRVAEVDRGAVRRRAIVAGVVALVLGVAAGFGAAALYLAR